MIKIAAPQRAKARARRLAQASANDNALAEAVAPEAAVIVPIFPREEDPPFDPPDAEDMLGLGDCEEENEFVAVAPPVEEEIFEPEKPKSLANAPRPIRTDVPLPAITAHAFWERPESATLLSALAADRRLANAQLELGRGDIDAAAARYARGPSPDLLILDTALHGQAMLAALERLRAVLAPQTKLVILGAVNDIGLLRELAARGVSEYIVPPLDLDAIAGGLCRLYENTDASHVIAVIGARGGVGASTIAQNLAWSIAERQQARTTLVDLDLAFGVAAASFDETPPHSVVDVLAETADETLDRCIAALTPRLSLLSAPATVAREFEIEAQTLQATIARLRRKSSFVVLDLPHAWNDWIKQTLLTADRVLIVAGPDLASLRNADNMLKLIRSEDRVAAPIIALSMVGVPKRPEIALKDFAEALMVEPSASFPFDPAIYAQAAMDSQMIGEAAPGDKLARALDELACTLTGREIVAAPPVSRKRRAPSAEARPLPPPKPTPPAPPLKARADYITSARLAADAAQSAAPAEKPQRRRSSGLLRLITIAIALVAAIAWYAQRPREVASAETRRAVEGPPAPPPAAAPAPLDAATQYDQAVAMLESGSVGEGIGVLRVLAESGFAPAQFSLAKIYERGEGVEADAEIARQWTERAAAAGHPRAMHDLGVYFARSGDDDAAAFRWFRQAAAYGVVDSQFNLGVFYQQGRSVSADPTEALFWFKLAARDGDEAAVARVAALEAQLTPVQIENARARAEAFRPQTARVD